MRPTNPWKSYRQIATQTAPPGQLVLMLFDGAIRSIDRALLGFDCADVSERNATIHNNLQRAVEILRELNGSLDHESGGQLAETLSNLYLFFENRLVDSNLKKTRKGIDEIAPMLRQIRDSWAAMLKRQHLDDAAPAGAAESWAAANLMTA